jgi:hypothetical protein
MMNSRDLGQVGNQIIGQTVGKVLLLRIVAQVVEGQDRDRGPVGQRQLRSLFFFGWSGSAPRVEVPSSPGRHDHQHDDARSDRWPGAPPPRHGTSQRGAIRAQPIDPDGLGDVLDRLLAQEICAERQLTLDLVVDAAGDVHTTGFGQRLEPGGDIDAIAEQIVALDHDVAEIDADAEFEAPVLGQLGVAAGKLRLDLDRTSHGLDGACELGEHAIAGGTDDAAVVARDPYIHLQPVGVQGAERAFLVGRHEAAVALHVGTQDGRELTLDARRGSRRLHCAPVRCLQSRQCRFAKAA